MAKIMLVEDDNNLREIYGARLQAEGYDIVAAKDGEEALALAVKEKPNLIIADIMMPKISGFDMLDILRTTPETKDTKVIVMTALNQAEDKAHAEQLGADRYLVKSQVTLEDVVGTAKELLVQSEPSASPVPTTLQSPPTAAATTSTTNQRPAESPTSSVAIEPPAPPEPTSPVASQQAGPTVATPVQPASPTPIPVTVHDESNTTQATNTQNATQTANDQVLADAVAKIDGAAGQPEPPSAPPISADGSIAPSAATQPPSNASADATKVEVRTSKVIQPLNDV